MPLRMRRKVFPKMVSRTIRRRHRTARRATVLISMVCACSCLVLWGCRSESVRHGDQLFELLDASDTNIDFSNVLGYEYDFNIYRYRNFYNGGGVGLGDINNDGFLDVFFAGNQVPNRLYLNNGDFSFTDVTEQSGVAGKRAWSTGVSIVDVNGDGWLDVYVCNSGIVEGDDRKNELYINNGDSTFTEMAEEFGLADAGLSIHGSFLDYDRDGDLDLYLVNNSYRNIGSFNLQENTRHIRHRAGGDRLFRNSLISDSAGGGPLATLGFTDVSEEAGIYGSEIGFGLGVSVGDLNRDGWPDMYVSNDFFERDYLYLNNQDGTFDETLEESIKSVSAAAMGADMADLNGDGYPEIFVTDMLPKEEYRLKTVTSFDSWERYQNYIEDDYYHQFTRNTLHLNRGRVSGGREPSRGESANYPGEPSRLAFGPRRPHAPTAEAPSLYFSEIGRMSGVEASDWSWGAMIADFDHDGYRDLFVANGIYQDLTNADYLVEIRDEETMNELTGENYVDFKTLIDMIPSNPISNFMFAGSPDLRFRDVTSAWGLSEPGFSNGSAYGDLDNDGDLDLVVNNVNMEAFVYRNRATDLYPERTWLQVDLKGPSPNTFAVGAQVTAWSGERQWYVEQQPVRGFQSTVDHTLHLGLGSHPPLGRLDSLVVRWPDGSVSTLNDVDVNQRLTIRYSDTDHAEVDWATRSAYAATHSVGEGTVRPAREAYRRSGEPGLLERLNPAELGLEWRHRENAYNDFDRQPLLFHMRSTEGPPVCVGDVDGDGRQDLYLGGAKDQAGTVFVQNRTGRFERVEQLALQNDRISEDSDCIWFDADGDGDVDLFVASGGSEFPASSSALMDRLYLNDGAGRLVRSDQPMISASAGFEPTGAVAAADVDGDGDVDLFVGTRLRPFAYGVPVDGHLLLNDGTGKFVEVTDSLAPELRGLGMITDAQWADVDGDGDPDLMIAGEWMPLTLFENQAGKLINRTTEAGLGATAGWWNAIEWADLDDDGDPDLIAANHGLNSRFRATQADPVEIWVDDFDRNGSVEQVIAIRNEGRPHPMALRHDLIDQIPSLIRAYPTYESYAGQSVHDVFSEEQLRNAIHHRVVQLQSVVGWNDGQGRFRIEPLPFEAQLAPMYGIEVTDIDADGKPEILMGGNLYETKPEVGRYDASYGVVTAVDRSGLQTLPFAQSGFWVTGPVRKIELLRVDGRRLLVVARNDDSLTVFTYGD